MSRLVTPNKNVVSNEPQKATLNKVDWKTLKDYFCFHSSCKDKITSYLYKVSFLTLLSFLDVYSKWVNRNKIKSLLLNLNKGLNFEEFSKWLFTCIGCVVSVAVIGLIG